jgi:hypothetical protein
MVDRVARAGHSREDLMKRTLRCLVSGGLLAAAAIPLTSSCADNRSTIFIAGVLKQIPPTCIVVASAQSAILGAGLVDVSISSSYRAWFLTGNEMVARGDKQSVRTETSRVTINKVEVRLTDSTGEALNCGDQDDCGAYSVFATGFVDVARGEDPGYGAFNVEVIPSIVGASLADSFGGGTAPLTSRTTVIANVKASGVTLGGEDVKSAEFTFPIEVCYGCLINYNAIDVTTRHALCTIGDDHTPGSYCGFGQDDPVSCEDCFDQKICADPYDVLATTNP